MRAVPAAVQAYRDAGKPHVQRELVWIAARDAAGSPQPAGFWPGRQARAIQVIDPATGATVTRTYLAAGALMAVEPVRHASGLDIVSLRVTLSPIDATVEQAARGYDLRFVPVEIHRLWLDYDTRAALAPAQVWQVGHVNAAPITTPEANGEATLRLTVTPLLRALTVANPDLLSDDVQRRRMGDRMLRYIAGAASRDVPWGSR